jgi:hypothetical protein
MLENRNRFDPIQPMIIRMRRLKTKSKMPKYIPQMMTITNTTAVEPKVSFREGQITFRNS